MSSSILNLVNFNWGKKTELKKGIDKANRHDKEKDKSSSSILILIIISQKLSRHLQQHNNVDAWVVQLSTTIISISISIDISIHTGIYTNTSISIKLVACLVLQKAWDGPWGLQQKYWEDLKLCWNRISINQAMFAPFNLNPPKGATKDGLPPTAYW